MNVNLIGKKIEAKDGSLVTITDSLLPVVIGHWLYLIDYKVMDKFEKRQRLPFLDAIKLRVYVSGEILQEVHERFGRLLKMADIHEACVLSDYDFDTGSFKCHLVASNKDINLRLRCGDGFDFCDELIIWRDGDIDAYNYFRENETNKERLPLARYMRFNYVNGITLTRFLSEYSYSVHLAVGEMTLDIRVNAPGGTHVDVCRLNNEEAFEQFLLNLSFPISLQGVYDSLVDTCLSTLDEYPKISIELRSGRALVDSICVDGGSRSGSVLARDKNN